MKANKAEIAVFVSGGGTNLQALIDAQKSGIIEHGEIKLDRFEQPERLRARTRGESGNQERHGQQERIRQSGGC